MQNGTSRFVFMASDFQRGQPSTHWVFRIQVNLSIEAGYPPEKIGGRRSTYSGTDDRFKKNNYKQINTPPLFVGYLSVVYF